MCGIKLAPSRTEEMYKRRMAAVYIVTVTVAVPSRCVRGR